MKIKIVDNVHVLLPETWHGGPVTLEIAKKYVSKICDATDVILVFENDGEMTMIEDEASFHELVMSSPELTLSVLDEKDPMVKMLIKRIRQLETENDFLRAAHKTLSETCLRVTSRIETPKRMPFKVTQAKKVEPSPVDSDIQWETYAPGRQPAEDQSLTEQMVCMLAETELLRRRNEELEFAAKKLSI